MAHEEEALGKAYDSRLMRRLIAYLRPYRGRVVLAITITILLAALGPLRPWLVMKAIDDVVANDMAQSGDCPDAHVSIRSRRERAHAPVDQPVGQRHDARVVGFRRKPKSAIG